MHRLSLLGPLAALAALAHAPGQDRDDWRAFRGDGTATGTSRPPIEWDDDTNVRWKVELPGPGTSSPIVVGDGVFVTCWSGYGLDREAAGDLADLKRHLSRYRADTGELVWSVTIDAADEEDEFGGRMANHGYASGTPASDGESIFAFFGKAGVYAFDLDGEERWHASVGTGSSKWHTGSGSSPAVWGDLVLVNASDESESLVALNKANGEELWRRSSPALDQAYDTPVVGGSGGDTVVLLALLGEVWGLEPATGEPKWTVTTKTGGALAPTILVDGAVIYSYGGRTRMRSYAIRLGGEGDVTESHVTWASRYGPYVVTPLLSDGHVYWVSESGIAFCADAKTGEPVYQERLEGSFYASPVRAGEAIYVVSRNDGTYVLPAAPEFEVLAHNTLDDESSFDGTPAVSGDRLFLRSRESLYCIGR